LVVVDLVDEPGKKFLAASLAIGGGVVVLGGPELDAGLEVAAGFADGLEDAVQLGRAGAVAVAQQTVVLAAQPGQLRAGGVGGELGGRAVERFGFLADGEVLLSDGTAGMPAVIGWDGSVGDRATTLFAGRLYRGLAGGADLVVAAGDARRVLLHAEDPAVPGLIRLDIAGPAGER
jgi:hypothetical protein